MKAHKIELKTVAATNLATGQEFPFSYIDGIRVACASGGRQGMSTDDLIKATELVAEVKKAGDAILLSPPDYEWLVRRVNQTVWTDASEALAQFIIDIRTAPAVDVTEHTEEAA